MNKDEETSQNQDITPEELHHDVQDADALVSATQDTDTAEETEEVVADDRVFGMPRPIFRGVALGVACGFILHGIIGAMGFTIDGMLPVVGCGALGWWIAKKLQEKKQAKEADVATSFTTPEQ